jgi:hypothetical protein
VPTVKAMFAFILDQILQFWPPYRPEHQQNDAAQRESLSEVIEVAAQNDAVNSVSLTDAGRHTLAR